MDANDFYEDDEPLEDVIAAFNAGEKRKTRPKVLTVDYRQTLTGWRVTSPDTPDINFRERTKLKARRRLDNTLRELLGTDIPIIRERTHRTRKQASTTRVLVDLIGRPKVISAELSLSKRDHTRNAARSKFDRVNT